MVSEAKIFFKYLFDWNGIRYSFKKQFIEVTKPKNISFFLYVLGIVAILFLKDNTRYIVSGLLWLLGATIQLRAEYISGNHLRWWKLKQKANLLYNQKEVQNGRDTEENRDDFNRPRDKNLGEWNDCEQYGKSE